MSPPNEKKLSDLLSELKAEYLLKLPEKIKLLKQLIAKREWVAVEEEFHKLKGTGKTYGFADVSTVCEKLEVLAHHQDTQLPPLFNQAIELLEKMLEQYNAGQVHDLSTDKTMKSILSLNTHKRLKP